MDLKQTTLYEECRRKAFEGLGYNRLEGILPLSASGERRLEQKTKSLYLKSAIKEGITAFKEDCKRIEEVNELKWCMKLVFGSPFIPFTNLKKETKEKSESNDVKIFTATSFVLISGGIYGILSAINTKLTLPMICTQIGAISLNGIYELNKYRKKEAKKRGNVA